MTNWFASIGQASSGLSAAQYGLSVVSQNIENADTDGYTHQSITQAAVQTTPSTGIYTRRTSPGLEGVTVASTDRSDDPVLDRRMRSEHATGAAVDTTVSGLADLEQILPEPSTTGLSAQLSDFWGAWGTVSNAPDSTTSRGLLLRSASAVAGTLNSLTSSLSAVASDTSASLDNDLAQANSAAQRLSTLNGQISIASATGQNANALLDQRDQLLDSLSRLVGGVATIGAGGAVSVTVGGQSLVAGSTVNTMTADATGQVSVGGSAVTLSGGSASARVTALTTTIPGYQARLDAIADSVSSAGNSIQAAGYDLAGNVGADMFSGSGAAGITVSLTDPSGIAASSTPGGNLGGGNAATASQYGTVSGGPDSLYTSLIGDVASASALAQQQQTTQAAVTTNVDSLHASISGVSYDEEVSQMLTYQHAFSASSRVLTTIDQMLDTLINHTGVVGLS